ncbi:hypothetical protein C1645_817310 [Glomus cerebriforme]|uniref:Uncharacterized protein n=1 Tax=Glomus cerebriforme TaxID=658196 RepID=A0A397T9K6_9GLOM|nr:hypothetical protein C1645_817310 [Glomus cerebriforme]
MSQQNQIITLSKTATQQQETSSAIYNNYDISTTTSIVVSEHLALTSSITSDAQIDTISCTGKEAIQNDWEFYNDINEYMQSNPNVHAPITSDSIRGVKHKMQDDINDHNESEEIRL